MWGLSSTIYTKILSYLCTVVVAGVGATPRVMRYLYVRELNETDSELMC